MDPRDNPVKPRLDDIDAKTREAVWAIISPRIGRIFDSFLEAVMDSEHRQLFDNKDHNEVKLRQIEHWQSLFIGDNGSKYHDKLNLTYINHKDINIPSIDYIQAYILFMTEFHRAVLQSADGPKQAYEFVRTVNAVVAGDIERAMRIYNDAHSV